MIITLTEILRAERDRRNREYPRMVSAGQLTSAEANQRWARFNTLLPQGGVGTDMARRYYTDTPEAIAEYRRWISDELATEARNATAVVILEAWLRGIEGPPPAQPSNPSPESATQTSLFS